MNPLLKFAFLSRTFSWALGLFLAFASFGLMQFSFPYGVITLIGSIAIVPPVEDCVKNQGILVPMWVRPTIAFVIFMTFGITMGTL